MATKWCVWTKLQANDRHGHCLNPLQKKGEEKNREDESKEEGERSQHVSHSAALKCADTFWEYMDQRVFKYSDIKASRIICTVIRKLKSSQ